MDGRDLAPRKHVGHHVVFSADMSHIGGKIADEGHVAGLTGRMLDSAVEGEGEGLMVNKYGELVAFDMVAKVFYSKEDGQQLAVKSAVLPLSIGELPGEESHRVQDAAEKLLKLTTNLPVRSAHCDAGLGV